MADDLSFILTQTDLREPDDELESVFKGSSFTHVLSIRTDDQLDVALTALQAVRAGGGALDGLHLTRRGGGLEHRLTLVGVRPHEARRLADQIAALPGVETATVEHHILRGVG